MDGPFLYGGDFGGKVSGIIRWSCRSFSYSSWLFLQLNFEGNIYVKVLIGCHRSIQDSVCPVFDVILCNLSHIFFLFSIIFLCVWMNAPLCVNSERIRSNHVLNWCLMGVVSTIRDASHVGKYTVLRFVRAPGLNIRDSKHANDEHRSVEIMPNIWGYVVNKVVVYQTCLKCWDTCSDVH